MTGYPGWRGYYPPSSSTQSGDSWPSKSRNKFNARKMVTADGTACDSAKEARRWNELLLLQQAGEIISLMAHPQYELVVNDILVGKFTPDSSYITKDGEMVIEDVKSEPTKTTAYRLRKRLFEACHYPLRVTEV